MAAYTPSLRLTLPVTGTDDGTWGDTVNNGITLLTDASIAGTATVIQGDVANYTLTNNSGATDEARNMFLNITGALTAARNVVCPTASKLYFIKNSTTGGFAVTLKTSAGTGISVPAGSIMALYCDGTNVVDAITYATVINTTTVDTTNLEVTNIKAKDGTASITLADTTGIATFSKATVISTSDATNAALRVTQTGAGDALLVEDATNPDSTPFVVNNAGKVLIARTTASVIADAAMQINVQSASIPAMLTNTGSTSYRPHWSLAVADTEVASFGTTNTLLNTYVGGASRMTISALGSTVLYPVTGAGSGLTVSGTNLSGSTTNISVFSNTTFGSAATTRGEGFQTTLGTEAATFTLGEMGHFKAVQGTIGLNSVVTNQYGFLADSTLIGATNNYGFYSNIASTSGRFNFYANGTATNYFSGSVGIGSNAPSSKVQITVGEATAYNGTATDGQLAAGSTLFIQQTSGTNTGVAQIVFQPRTTFPYNRIVSSGGSAPFLTFVTNNAEAMRITSAGYVGVGTTSPSTKLDVLGTPVATSGGLVTIYDTSATGINSTLGSLVWASGPGTDFYIGKKSESAIGSLSFGDASSGTEFMRLDTAGNLGLGVTPSAWYTGLGLKALQVGASAFVNQTNGYSFLERNAYSNASDVQTYIGSGYAERYQQGDGAHAWYNAPSGTAGAAITFTQAMTLNASGNLGVGTTSPNSKLHVDGGSSNTIARVSSSTGYALLTSTNLGGSTYFGLDTSAGALTGTAYATAIFSSANTPIIFSTNSTERMRLDSAGNLGLGVTPSAWTPTKVLQLGGEFLAYSGVTGYLTTNTYYGSLGFTYNGTGFATRYEQTSGKHVWYTAPSGTAGNAITFTQAMTLNASGNLGVGTTSPTTKLQVINPDASWSTTGTMTSGSAFGYNMGGTAINIGASTGKAWIQSSYANNAGVAVPLSFVMGGAEAMTLDASGNFLAGTTNSNPISARVNGNVLVSTGGFNSRAPVSTRDWAISATSGSIINFYSDNGSAAVYAGSILVNGNVTSYNSVSDYRLKENVQPMTGALAKVQALNPVTYTFKDGGQVSQGFIAHELQAVIPDAVTGEKDAVKEDGSPAYQGVDTSFLVATLTAAIQEQQALITALTDRITALEAK